MSEPQVPAIPWVYPVGVFGLGFVSGFTVALALVAIAVFLGDSLLG